MQAWFPLNYKEFTFFIKNTKNSHYSASDCWEHTIPCFKKNAKTFSKNSTTQGNIRISRMKMILWNLYWKDNLRPEIKPTIDKFINCLNFLN